ncbi:MAG TPA: hypothetical protein VMW65_05520, partial [Chloroflexota bacterium]|nr:hypothetical protein [Chloroflexota bacterium]
CVDAPERSAATWELAVPSDAISLNLTGTDAHVTTSRVVNTGWLVRTESRLAGEPLEVLISRDQHPERPVPGISCALSIDGRRCHLMPRDGERTSKPRPTSTETRSNAPVGASEALNPNGDVIR